MLKHLTNSTQILTFNAFHSLAGGTQWERMRHRHLDQEILCLNIFLFCLLWRHDPNVGSHCQVSSWGNKSHRKRGTFISANNSGFYSSLKLINCWENQRILCSDGLVTRFWPVWLVTVPWVWHYSQTLTMSMTFTKYFTRHELRVGWISWTTSHLNGSWINSISWRRYFTLGNLWRLLKVSPVKDFAHFLTLSLKLC